MYLYFIHHYVYLYHSPYIIYILLLLVSILNFLGTDRPTDRPTYRHMRVVEGSSPLKIYNKNIKLGKKLSRFCRFTFVFGQSYESVAKEF